MTIEKFVKKAIEQDKRNIFEKSEVADFVPNILKDFYKKANPINVEITMNQNVVKFMSISELEKSQLDYLFDKERFVFASCNGDPIYIYNNQIYTCCHGTNEIEDEFMAENLSDFFDMID